MRRVKKPSRTIVNAAVLTLMAVNTANAAGFSLYNEGSAAAIGNYAAGIAAEAADAATGWYNPAGLVLLHEQQVIFSGVGVFPSSKISGTSTFTTLGLSNYTQHFSGVNGAKDAFVPAFHYALPLGEKAAFGLSVVSPFGLATDWSRTGPVRYEATQSDLLTFDFSPELAGRINDNLAIGAGVDFEYASVKFNQVLGAPALMQAFDFPAILLDSLSYNKAHSTTLGFHAGLLGIFNENHTRVGFNFQSEREHKFHGNSRLTGRLASPGIDVLNPFSILLANPAAVFTTTNLSSNKIHFPAIATLSGYHDVNPKLALLGSVVFSGWDVFKTLQLNNVAAFVPSLGQVSINSVTAENFRNAWRLAVGANYRWDDQWMLRLGGGYDETPTVDTYRSVRLPDSSRWALAVGAHYQWREDIGVDFGYAHLFSTGDASINRTEIAGVNSTFNVSAQSHNYADLVGLQVVWTIDKKVVPAMTK